MSTTNETLGTQDGRPVLRIERRLAHRPEKVWRAITEPTELSRWFPFQVTALDLRVGGAVHFDDGHGTTMDAVVVELDPLRVFAFLQHPPAMMTRESDNVIRFELRPDGEDGCLLVFTHAFHDRPAAASYASGWQMCLDVLGMVVDGAPVEPRFPHAELHDAYVGKFGLDAGTVEETPDGGWCVRFERQLTQPAGRVWAALAGAADAEPRVGEPVPPGFTAGQVATGAVAGVEAPALLEYAWHSGGRPAGRVRWEMSAGTGHGARLVVTQTGARELAAERETAQTAWRDRIGQLAKELQAIPPNRPAPQG